ncbi:hypothetical protein Fmac_018021 [Flemingia macrophylla]|uniref:Uncharacterized protein n=1 Tax=Flemingia macrophylla TaxID=520843 RepID=A0ABD1M5K9_9FABA
MADPSQWQATYNFHQQTFNLTTPVPFICNYSHDSFTKQRHKIYAFTLPILLCFLQVQSLGNTTSPFQVHPMTTKACVFGILGYYLAFRAWLCLSLYATQLSIVMAVFGSFSLASLVSLLFSDSWWHIKYVLYVLLVAVELHQIVTILFYEYDKYFVKRLTLLWKSWCTKSVQRDLPLTCMDLIESLSYHKLSGYVSPDLRKLENLRVLVAWLTNASQSTSQIEANLEVTSKYLAMGGNGFKCGDPLCRKNLQEGFSTLEVKKQIEEIQLHDSFYKAATSMSNLKININ